MDLLAVLWDHAVRDVLDDPFIDLGLQGFVTLAHPDPVQTGAEHNLRLELDGGVPLYDRVVEAGGLGHEVELAQ